MNRSIGLVLAALVMLARPSVAQTTNASLEWDHADALANVQKYQTTLQIDGGPAAFVQPSCTATSANLTHCKTPVAASLASGTHSFVVTVFLNGQSAQGSTGPTSPGPGPKQPITITLTFTVTIP